jgi:hypothetical protein
MHEGADLETVLSGLPLPSGVADLPAPIPRPWQFSMHGTLGVGPAVGVWTSDDVFLDLRKLALCDSKGREVVVTRSQASLLTTLVMAGDAGVSCVDVEQSLLEVDQIESWYKGGRRPWRVLGRESEGVRGSLRNRLKVARSRLNARIRLLGFKILSSHRGKEVGRWRLVDAEYHDRSIALKGTLWEALETPGIAQVPERLTGSQTRLWGFLADNAPQSMSVETLAGLLGIDSENGRKRVVDGLARLERHMAEIGFPYRVARVQRGEYVALPRPPP